MTKFSYATLFYTLLLSVSHAVFSEEPKHYHQINMHTPVAKCTDCHIETPLAKLDNSEIFLSKNHPDDNSAFKQDGIAMCSSCHDPENGHQVGLNIDFTLPADLPLSLDNKLTCLTCHYMHGDLASERPQASYSVMDTLTDAERLHKSFLLRRSNVDGELCFVCHNVSQEAH
ncbi:cytochrome c3 family protein [Methylocucumis oryzae]|uniref:Cytochrome c7-like domain-containing protein n=1 Tax=Methylocucumis oryzae TaxID=1632867 RepID=A0A0F3IKW3_9GAMM|nr:cytochrome c3 family protein [Methylocucumis oryzae]KJV07163.1 hypothetical protein VZ94_06555 [Methylocucumis oryzae]